MSSKRLVYNSSGVKMPVLELMASKIAIYMDWLSVLSILLKKLWG